jgi:GNAT superfamily N-acetyltransferase
VPPAPSLRLATPADLGPLAGVLASAFFADPPFVWMLPDERRRAARLRRFFEIELRHVGLARGVVWTTDDAAERQGRGLGTALMQPTLERCTREALPAYLEATCERNARLYERLGFHLIGELQYGGSEPLRLMLRPPG